ncbi:hypothetical protein DINM_007170 [Dirofilaria immitis]|nr:hypothetical protein [Dirofilaria immitis]
MYRKGRKGFESNIIRRNGYEPIAQFENSRTPPDYLVRETADGRLLSDNCEVEWPKRPPYGRYAERSAQTLSAVSKLLRKNDFRLYYQVPLPGENIVPIRIPLCLAYRSAIGKVYHFPIACTIDEGSGRESWRVLYGDPRPSSFATLSALVKYHKIYSYMDPKQALLIHFLFGKNVLRLNSVLIYTLYYQDYKMVHLLAQTFVLEIKRRATVFFQSAETTPYLILSTGRNCKQQIAAMINCLYLMLPDTGGKSLVKLLIKLVLPLPFGPVNKILDFDSVLKVRFLNNILLLRMQDKPSHSTV